jgi:hypothetical protein
MAVSGRTHACDCHEELAELASLPGLVASTAAPAIKSSGALPRVVQTVPEVIRG